MKNKKNKTKKKEGVSKLVKDIDSIIDNMAYSGDGQNIKKSKSFLDNMYLLKDE